MKIGILTNEFPPAIYGGAGVHVEYLTRELARLDDASHEVCVLAFGKQANPTGNMRVKGIQPVHTWETTDPRHSKAIDPLIRNLEMAVKLEQVDVVHCHTWYAQFAGCLVKQFQQIPLVLTTHSLEPHRPWKVEQLGTGYHVSSWIEKTAYQNADGVVAVSQAMRQDVHDLYGVPFEKTRVIHNGIDLDQYQSGRNDELMRSYGVDPAKPIVLFVGRITRQKGIVHLVKAIPQIAPGTQIVLLAGAPDTPEIGQEMTTAVEEARKHTSNPIIWIPEMLARDKVIAFYSHADVFVCPSVYEPFGIINLEAMACHTPVVASAVGGIPEIVVEGETGLLVPVASVSASDPEPLDPAGFAAGLAGGINRILADPDLARQMAVAGRKRVEEHFSWTSIARQTLDFYTHLIN